MSVELTEALLVKAAGWDVVKRARAFIEHLCTYGLRRALSFDDQDDLNAIQAEAKKSQYRIQDIVRAVAMSELMRKR